MKKGTALLQKLKDVSDVSVPSPVQRVVEIMNPVLRGWVNYFAVGQSSRCFGYVRGWVKKKVRRHLMRARNRKGFGWNRWSRDWLATKLGLFNDHGLRREPPKALPT
jgi:RNA-directed DNA polymerase